MSGARRVVVLAVCVALALAGCSKKTDGGSATKTAKLTVTANEASADAFSFGGVPAEVDGGPVEVTLTNNGKESHEFSVITVDGDKTDEQIKSDFRKIAGAEGTIIVPAYLHAWGIIPEIPAGKTKTGTFVAPAGKYYYLCIVQSDSDKKAHFDKGMYGTFTVKGGGGSLPASTATVTAKEYSLTPTGLKAGTNAIKFENTGTQLHHFVIAPLAAGKTLDEVKTFLASNGQGASGPPPIDFEKSTDAPVIDGGHAVEFSMDIPAGRYAMICFLNDRAGGAPHFTLGMLAEVTVA